MPDIFPQPLKFQTAGPTTTTLGTELRFPLILPRRETATQRITTEIIAVRYDIGGVKQEQSLVANAGIRIALSLRALTAAEIAVTLPTVSLGDTAIIDVLHSQFRDAGVAASRFEWQGVTTHDLTGGTGVGKLIPGDRIFYNAGVQEDAVATQTIGLEIYYRQHLVGLEEYLGILAALQQNPS